MTEQEAIDAFCLEPLTVLDVPAEETVGLAAATGCRFMSLWVQSPQPDYPARCLVESGPLARRVAQSLADNGIRARNLEVFAISPDTDVSLFRPALEIGASLGAQSATALLREGDFTRRVDQFVALCQLGAQYNLQINAEFVSYHSLGSLDQAVELIAAAKQPNAGIVVDLLHLTRSGGSPEQVRRMDPALIGHAQVCDGPATIRLEDRPFESASDRMIPGEGDFPVRAFLDALPPAPLGLEVPFKAAAFEGMSPLARVTRLVEATRRVLAAGGETAAAEI